MKNAPRLDLIRDRKEAGLSQAAIGKLAGTAGCGAAIRKGKGEAKRAAKPPGKSLNRAARIDRGPLFELKGKVPAEVLAK